jgi:hypothetical protein
MAEKQNGGTAEWNSIKVGGTFVNSGKTSMANFSPPLYLLPLRGGQPELLLGLLSQGSLVDDQLRLLLPQ